MSITIWKQAEELATVLPRLMRHLNQLNTNDPVQELPITQLRVCSLLYDGPLSMSALSKELGVTLSAMTQLADRLEKAEMVERVQEPDDRRVKMLRLSDQGKKVMKSRREKRVKLISRILEALPPESRADVLSACKTLLETASALSPEETVELGNPE